MTKFEIQHLKLKCQYKVVCRYMKKLGFKIATPRHNVYYANQFINKDDVSLTFDGFGAYVELNRNVKKSSNIMLTDNIIKAEMVLECYVKHFDDVYCRKAFSKEYQ